jgi:alpha-D-ribose 1-methylphosphonate 5-triphosphate diphosphatase
MTETILTNARVVTETDVFLGTIRFGADGIREVDAGATRVPGAIDAEGDFVAPGLIEMHTDNLEKHFMPRPKVFWPDGLAATLAHDAQMAAAGVTTVYDAICAGVLDAGKAYRQALFGRMIEAVETGQASGLFRIDHKLHLRCELTNPHILEEVEPHVDRPLVELVSLMDHTPGQRQFRQIEYLKTYAKGAGDRTDREIDADLELRMREGPKNVQANWDRVVALFASRGIPIASHDDTTPEHVDMAAASGCTISEFPTTIEAASEARGKGMTTIAGAPNVVRGGSHSGNVSAQELAEHGLLDGLSSDYVPSSLLQAIGRLDRTTEIGLPKLMGLVTWGVADLLRLHDRGRLAPGLRADVLRFRFAGETPVVRELYVQGRRVL